MKPNIAEKIAEYRKMLAAATPGPWNYEEGKKERGDRRPAVITHMDEHGDEWIHGDISSLGDAELIAKAPETIESLIGEVERLQTDATQITELAKKRYRQVKQQAEEIDAMQKVIKEQDELLDSANNAIEPLNDELEYERKENERLRKALEGIATSKTSLASTLKTMAGEALRRDTHDV